MVDLDKLNSTHTTKLSRFGVEEKKPIEVLDFYATAIANGYSPAQAESLAKWKAHDFIIFINNMTRADGKPKEWVFKKVVPP